MGTVISGRHDLAATPIQTDAKGRLIVRGENQLFTFKDTFELIVNTPLSGAGGYMASGAVPAGEIWVITAATAIDVTGATTRISFARRSGVWAYTFGGERGPIGVSDMVFWSGHEYCKEDDLLWTYFIGAGAADVCYAYFTGYIMTKET